MNTATGYQFSLTGPRFGIDPAALYGFWERKDGSEGGGLQLARTEGGTLELIDFSGGAWLPLDVVVALRAAGVSVSGEFNTSRHA